MKIAIFCNTLSFRRGAERLLLNILDNAPKDFEVTIFTRDYNKKTAFEGFEKFKIVKFTGLSDLLKIKKFDLLFSWLAFPNYLFGAIVKRFNKNNKNTKLVWYSGGAYLPNRLEPKLKDWPKKIISDWAIKHVDKIFTLSDYIGDEIRKYNKRETTTVYCGLEVNDFKVKKYIPDKIPLILYPTFIHSSKGIYDVYKAASNLLKKGHNFKLVITGGGPDKEKLEELAKSENLHKNIIVKENIEDKDLKELYNKCDFVLYPVFKSEFGLVSFEAMLYNKPVIFRDEAAQHEILKDTNMPRFKTVKELEEKIKFLIENRQKSRKLGKEGRKFVTDNLHIKFTVNKLKKELSKI